VPTDSRIKKFIPGFNTLKILEKRKNYILDKLESKIEKEAYTKYLIEEIRALEKAMDFIKWIQNNVANDNVREIVNQYELENEKSREEENDKENETEEIGNIENATVYGIIDEKQNKNHKFEIIFSKDEGVNYISIASQRRKKDNISWEKTDEIKMTVHKLEKILKKEKELEVKL